MTIYMFLSCVTFFITMLVCVCVYLYVRVCFAVCVLTYAIVILAFKYCNGGVEVMLVNGGMNKL